VFRITDMYTFFVLLLLFLVSNFLYTFTVNISELILTGASRSTLRKTCHSATLCTSADKFFSEFIGFAFSVLGVEMFSKNLEPISKF
jgi:hypothetical protein